MHNPAYSIKTDRLLIRCYNPEDAFLLKEAIDQSLDHLLPWMKWAESEPEDIENKIQRIRTYRANFDRNNNYVFGIFLPDNSKQIGSAALKKTIGDDALEIGYWIHKDYINKGYATEVTSALVRVGFEVEKVERIEIHCDPLNKASLSIPQKIGFNQEGILRSNAFDKEGNRELNMIWVLFKEEYEKLAVSKFPLEAFDVIGRKIV